MRRTCNTAADLHFELIIDQTSQHPATEDTVFVQQASRIKVKRYLAVQDESKAAASSLSIRV